MTAGASGPDLRGRDGELRRLDQLLAQARGGTSRVLVLRGEAGIGKSALLDHLSAQAPGYRVVRAAGLEPEAELAFAGLHQLCAPLLGHLDRLPAPQRAALATAFGLSTGPAPDRFLVGLAVLSLLSEAAGHQPLLCLVDDVQELDSASARVLAFVARRLLAEPVVLVAAVRAADGEHGFRGLPELALAGLGDADARALLMGALAGPLDASVRDQIVAESRGNPLALLELPRAFTPAELAGGFGLPGLPLDRRLEAGYARRFRSLPRQARRLLVTAAAEPAGDVALLWRAARAQGIEPAPASGADFAELVEFGTRVRFRHPLVRSAVYRSAPAADRRAAHGALAEVTDPAADPDRRAWHRARAVSGPDEEVAVELERSAGRAQARGGFAAAAALLERAAAVTAEPGRVAARALAAAQAKHQAGAPDEARTLLALASASTPGELTRARVDLLRARLAFTSSHGRDAPPLLLAAAEKLAPLDPALAREAYLEALAAGLYVGRLAGETGLRQVCEAMPPGAGSAGSLAAGLAAVVTGGYEAGGPALKRAVAAFRTAELPQAEAIRRLWLATHAAHDLWDDDSWQVLGDRHVRLAREAGALAILPIALTARIGLHLFAGELDAAATLVGEVAAVTEATGSGLPAYGELALAAYRGDETRLGTLAESIVDNAVRRGDGMGLTVVRHAQAVLHNGLCRYGEAFEAAADGAANPDELAFANYSLVQLVEAAVRSGRPERAADAFDRLVGSTRASGTAWASGIEARCRALLAEGDEAERSYREAIEHLGRGRMRLELARARLLYGEWLRRAGRRTDARAQLRTAHEAFTAMGAAGFAERARRELAATGVAARERYGGATVSLTAQEAQIARLARSGFSNPEIGAQLFLSARTVEWHLRKVFAKLGISSRRQLRSALPAGKLIASE
ncbi:helix-turn-helix transcriptional regulator [Amycolatopsis sacchari]|uniref:Regulatory protein, luxR family n=1 Tax=Amycolatopsis sacchari TaxID=115433 RepID=A0A1I3T185_9PSEU|nr:LuxR family transcriptional regulator [Amycolatopsis sacchari]SFJ64844.1 regulatory protein, luxR family [Amycolatopsis sacchari]